jgi:hypothetical protein
MLTLPDPAVAVDAAALSIGSVALAPAMGAPASASPLPVLPNAGIGGLARAGADSARAGWILFGLLLLGHGMLAARLTLTRGVRLRRPWNG